MNHYRPQEPFRNDKTAQRLRPQAHQKAKKPNILYILRIL
jgi:hypothetical protein